MTSFANFESGVDSGLDAYPASLEALPPTPRQIQVTFWTNAKRLGLLACLLLGPNVALIWGYMAGTNLRLLRDSGVQTTGTVEYLRAVRSGRSGYTYNVSYLLKVDGSTYLDQTTVTRDEYNRLTEGGPIVVTYLPSNPKINCVGTANQNLSKRNDTTLIMGGLVAVISGILLAFLEFAVRREIRLATHGVGTIGRIIDSGSQRVRNGTRYWARYEFSSPIRERAYGWHYVPRHIWDYIPVRQLVTILYDPENPSVHLPLYAFKYVNVNARPVPPQVAEFRHSTEAEAILRGPSYGITAHGGGSSWGYSGSDK